MRRLFNLKQRFPPLPATTIEELQDLRAKWTDDRNLSGLSRIYTFSELKARVEFQKWTSASYGSLLLLKGKSSGMRTDDCWLSLSALDFYRSLPQSGNHIFVEMKPGTKAHKLVWTIICRLLEANPELAHDDLALQEMLHSDTWTTTDPAMPCMLLSKTFQSFSDFVIVIDRLDLCECSGVVFLPRLVEVVRSARSKVKMLIVFEEMAPSKRIHREDISKDEEHLQIIQEDQNKIRS